MKNILFIKVFFVLPALLFAIYILMIALGCLADIINCGHDFFCGPYCLVGKIVLGLVAIIFLILIFPDIKSALKSGKKDVSKGQ